MKNWLKVFLILFLFGFIIYFKSLNNKFIFDDLVFINNPVLSQSKYVFEQWNPFHERSLGVVDAYGHLGYYRPLAHMLLDCCYGVFKNDFWKYHLLNLALFALASSFIFLFVERVSGNPNLAFLSASFYLIHPINGIIVNYISASVFACQLVFSLGTILLLLAALERGNNRGFYFGSLVCFFLSLFWHESGLVLPLYIGAYVLIFRQETLRCKALYLAPYFIIILTFIVFGFFFLGIGAPMHKHLDRFPMTGWEYWASLYQVLAWYICKLFYPQGIVMQWATPILHDHLFFYLFGLCLLLVVFALLLLKFIKNKVIMLGAFWFLIGFLPLGWAAFRTPENGVQVEPHWFIFSSIGFFILAAYFCLAILERSKMIGISVLFILIFTWGLVSYANNQRWADPKSYAQYWAQEAPHFKTAFFYLASAYQGEGAWEDSKKYYQMALTGYPSDIDIYNNLGAIAAAQGHLTDAERYYRMSLKISPYVAAVYSNLGELCLSEGRFETARIDFQKALSINPLFVNARWGLAKIYFRDSKYQKAESLCLNNLEIVPDDANTLLLLVSIYLKEKDIPNLNKYLPRILGHVHDPAVFTRLGVNMAENNFPLMALKCFEQAIYLDPHDADAYFNMGVLALNLRQYDQAILIWKQGMSLNPFDGRFKGFIAKAMALKSERASGKDE